MANRLDEFVRETIDELLKELSPKQRLEGLSPEQRLKGLSVEQRLEGLSPEELRAVAEAIQRRLRSNGLTAKPQ
jgi:hypothetical protein